MINICYKALLIYNFVKHRLLIIVIDIYYKDSEQAALFKIW